METHPIENLMVTAMNSLRDMIDVNTIIGDTVITPDGTTIIPVSRVCFGFAAGGSEFNTNKLSRSEITNKFPFGGGSGAGINMSPVAFLIVKEGTVKLLNVNDNKPLDKLVDLVPDIITKLVDTVDKTLIKASPRLKVTNKEE